MAIRVPEYEVRRLSEDEAARVQTPEGFVAGVHAEIAKRFMYEPMTDETISGIKDSVARAVQDYYGAEIQSVDIDDARDLEFKQKECRECAETSSYEEYQIKRAARNLPDEAGSEKNWLRMSQYKPGQINMRISYIPAQPMRQVECTIKIG